MRGTSLVTTATAGAIATRQVLRYASYTYDEPLSLYYVSQRYYDPQVAAFISRDPARADGEESAYQYCAGDPVGRVDPSGLAYSPSKAVAYAYKWWNGFNPSYKKNRYDCANFGSQCLVAGGMTMERTNRYETGWWGTKYGCSANWEQADLLYRYMKARSGGEIGTRRVYPNSPLHWPDARPGDLIFFGDSAASAGHTTLVTISKPYRKGKPGTGTRVACHTRAHVTAYWTYFARSYTWAHLVRPRG